MTDTEAIQETDAVHGYFGLTYANYLVLHRTLLQSMPDEWQNRFVTLLEEYDQAFDHVDRPEAFQVTAGTDCYVSELTDPQLKQLGITKNEVWEDDNAYVRTQYYNARGDEMGDCEHVVVPGVDPVAHYNRGRTYVEPRLGGGERA